MHCPGDFAGALPGHPALLHGQIGVMCLKAAQSCQMLVLARLYYLYKHCKHSVAELGKHFALPSLFWFDFICMHHFTREEIDPI